MLLSACLIAKNEALTLERCLTSLKEIADEVILVDTGSTDDTVTIAETHGAKVFHFTWDNDFAHARNEAIRQASGDWVLTIDADEYVDAEKAAGLRDYLTTTPAEGVFITVINYLGSLQRITKAMPIRVMRLFRNRHFYEGAVHEQIATSVFRSGHPTDTLDFVLHHVGYTEEFVRERGKKERNFSLLTKELESDPDNTFHRSNLMAEYLLQQNWERCAELGEETFRMIAKTPQSQWPNFTARIYMHWILALWNMGQRDKPMKLIVDGIKYFPWYTDMRKQHATMLLDTGKWNDAKDVLMKCREVGDTKSGLVEFSEGMGTYIAAHELGITWSYLGDDLVARKWFLQAFIENASLDGNIIPLLSLLPHDAAFLAEHIESRIVDPVVHANYAEAYATFGIPGAEALLQRSVQQYGIREQTERGWAAIHARESREALLHHVQRGNSEFHWFWIGLYELDHGDVESACDYFSKAGTRGQYMIQVDDGLRRSGDFSWGMRVILRDMVAVHMTRWLTRWLPKAVDRQAVWWQLKQSPIKPVLTEVNWKGDNVLECEQHALKCFALKDWNAASDWLNRAKTYEPTVTQVLIGCDIALAQNDINTARKVVYEGKKRYPESDAIQAASNMVHPKVDPVQLFQELKTKSSERSVLQ